MSSFFFTLAFLGNIHATNTLDQGQLPEALTEEITAENPESPIDSERHYSFLTRLAAATAIQLFSGMSHYTHVPGGIARNVPEQFNSFLAIVATYGLFTPYDFFAGISYEFPELTQELSAFLLALTGNYYVNPTALSPENTTLLWLMYLALGTLKNSELWNSSENIEAIQQIMREKSRELLSLAVGLASMLAIKQWDNYRDTVQQ